ncbi:c-type heme family protein [Parvicella tangerina]|uniref:Cytochrome c domain-containing protein n=1 Tax=Parvicella tangerina TaxID=2829795 RepID=A0A916NSI6_9FLAO|nr:DUF3365 domain-containing protein [Parvicella tangerina]CAG5083867.1 hypothetical protein CRYO30217_02315 [Parvicella tangerina]
MKKVLGMVVSSVLLLTGCTTPEIESGETTTTAVSELDGAKLVQQKCNSCHNPDTPPGSRLAPPFFAIQKHYKKGYGSKEDFIAAVEAFVLNPSEDKVLMKGAVKKFGVMPKMEFDQAELHAIAAYIYGGSFTHPSTESEALSPMEQGKEYALATKAVLGKNLMGQINANGTDAALTFCNEKAIHFTDSMANELGVKIKRVSDQNRNPDNAANAEELAYITKAKSTLKNGGEIKPSLTESEEGYVGYYPIMTNQMCLQCHGQKETQVKPSTLELLAQKYPNDQATGYSENELRGIWVIAWDK